MFLHRLFQSPRPRPVARLSLEVLGDRVVPAALWAGDVTLTEGHDGTRNAELRVTLDSPVRKTVTVNYTTVAGTAGAGTDFRAVSGKLTFFSGETGKTILIPVTGDRVAEADEIFTVRLSGAAGAQIGDGTGVVTITDDEPRISIAGVTGYRADSGTTPFTFTVSLSAAYDRAVTVNYATGDRTAVAGTDYLASSGTLTFAPGETTKTITVEVLPAATAGAGYKSFFVSLSGASTNALVAGGFAEGFIFDSTYDNTDSTNYWGSY